MTLNSPGTQGSHDLLGFLGLPRLGGLVSAPDGSRLIASVQRVNDEGNGYTAGLWELDPTGRTGARPPAGAVDGDRAPDFAPDGTLLLLSARPDPSEPDPSDAADAGLRLWALPGDGEARVIARHPGGGLSGFAVAGGSGTVCFTAALRPGAADAREHAALRRERQRARVTAVLYEDDDSSLARLTYQESGAEEPHTFVLRPDGSPVDAGGQGPGDPGATTLSADGALVAYTRTVPGETPGEVDNVVVVADAVTGEETRVLARPGHLYYRPAFTADATALVCQRQREQTPDHPWAVTLVRFDLTTGQETDLLPEFDNWPWPGGPVLSPVPGDGTLWFTGDERGHCPVFRRAEDGTVTRLTASGAYSALCVAPDGATLYALRGAIDSPLRVVRLDAAAPDQRPVVLDALGDPGPLPGTVTEVRCQGDDGFPLRAWLVLPEGARAERPAPLLVALHGGPQGSWNTWLWSCNPWPFAARGYAVLLPDPALSTGYGRRMQERGQDGWGGRPYRDVLALTDAALARPDLDADRTGVVGWSFGGYLANRIATRTDRFRAVVAHAGPWNLAESLAGSELAASTQRRHGDPLLQRERYDADSPHLDAARVRTPMLVVHGGQDSRVPPGQVIGQVQSLRRYRKQVSFLYFPDEGHVVRSLNNSLVWHETVLNFLDQHVLGLRWRRPGML
ncbi:alpha/beta fold hydrolase [Streptacidiphilus sp. P02-A3a]|uniref:S9 family peptidase n=1 Tax=Streptacidiphilus sp. P02-A3a TaxID=2704468 RepID=UPI0015FBD386|nr:alpha/beta fold hydrolase [Streptacidiphilus sp. P02-A3a]QMU73103.1 S9 family peptidase [Streptacidiphilus sp. P02-A3a]